MSPALTLYLYKSLPLPTYLLRDIHSVKAVGQNTATRNDVVLPDGHWMEISRDGHLFAGPYHAISNHPERHIDYLPLQFPASEERRITRGLEVDRYGSRTVVSDLARQQMHPRFAWGWGWGWDWVWVGLHIILYKFCRTRGTASLIIWEFMMIYCVQSLDRSTKKY